VLVGWSLGALEALEAVRRFGEDRIAGLVLVDSSVGEPPAPPPGKFPDALRRDRTAALNDFVRAIFRTPRPADEHQALVDGAMRLPLEASLALLAYPVAREHWRDIARNVRIPLLYVVTPQFAAQAKSLQQHRSATEIVVFERAGHALFADEPARFNALVDAFAVRVATR
jgi:microsomal epoxide hydrolase